MEIYLVRHGTTPWNALRKVQGGNDIPLDENGLDMARQTGEAFREMGLTFDRIYSSPLIRAYRTAETLAGEGAEILTDDRLREMSFGVYEGQNLETLYAVERGGFLDLWERPWEYRAPEGGESLEHLLTRAGDFLRERVEPLQAERILITAHCVINYGLLQVMSGDRDLSRFGKIVSQRNCGVIRITYENGKYTIDPDTKYYYSLPEGINTSFLPRK